MKLTLVNQALKVDSNSNFIALNLGTSAASEHRNGCQYVVDLLNTDKNKLHSEELKGTSVGIRKRLKYKSLIHKEEKLMSKWKNTPFGNSVFAPNTSVLVRKIIIADGSSLLKPGSYTYLCLASYSQIQGEKEGLGNKRKFDESYFISPEDYRTAFACKYTGSIGYIRDNKYSTVDHSFISGWDSRGLFFLISDELGSTSIASSITSALSAGNLALVTEEFRVMGGITGCILIDLAKAYGVKG